MRLIAVEHHLYAALAVLGTLAVVLAIGALWRNPALRDRAARWRGVVPPFVNIPGTLFALTLAFIANDTWVSRDRAMDAVFREAEALKGLMILSRALPGPASATLTGAVRAYGQGVAAEWPALRAAGRDPAAEAAADALLALAASPPVQGAGADAVGQAILDRVAALRSDRDMRIALTQTHLNPLKWMAMALLGCLTLLSIAAVHADAPRAGTLAVVLFALAAAPSAAIVLMQGNPFQPPAAVLPDPILAAIGAGGVGGAGP